MSETTYTYATTDDMPDGKVNASRLGDEIAASAILTALERIDTSGGASSSGVTTGGTLKIVFKAALSSGDKTILDGDTTDPAGGLLAAHDNSPSIVNTPVGVYNAADELVNWPMTSGDGDPTRMTPLSNPNILTPGYLFYSTGAFDDLDNDLRGKGLFMEVEQDGVGVKSINGRFFEHVYMHGGSFGCHNEGQGDWVEMTAWAPASAPTDRTSEKDGNADKVGILGVVSVTGTFQPGETVTGGTSGDTGIVAAALDGAQLTLANAGAFEAAETITGGTSGATGTVAATIAINQIVPNSGGTGWWAVDGSTLLVGEINENLTPVPNKTGAGYWNWDWQADPSITPAAGDGTFDLYDQPLPLVRQANRVGALLHEKDCCPEALKGKKMLPHWMIRFTINRGTEGTLLVQFILKTGRKSTVNMSDLA